MQPRSVFRSCRSGTAIEQERHGADRAADLTAELSIILISRNWLLVLNCACRLGAGPGSGCAAASRPGAMQASRWLARWEEDPDEVCDQALRVRMAWRVSTWLARGLGWGAQSSVSSARAPVPPRRASRQKSLILSALERPVA